MAKEVKSVTKIECRKGCGACCIAISISSAIPGHPNGKPAGVRCLQLNSEGLCSIFESDQRPEVCGSFQAEELFCGSDSAEAFVRIETIETMTV